MAVFKQLSWSLIGTVSNILFQFIGIVILSKLVTPSEYGVIGIIAFFTNIADMLIDSGMGGALIYKKNPRPDDFSTLFIYNLCVSLFLYFLLFFFAEPIARFYEIPALATYIKIYGLGIIIIALCIIQDCKLKKAMRFKTIAIISIVSNIISLSVAIYLAYNGFGIWALIVQHLLFLTLRTISLYIVCGFQNRYVFVWDSFKEQFSFGGWLFLANIINSLCKNLYSNIIPKIGTLTENGYYTQSTKISTAPFNMISLSANNVIFPYLAKSKDEQALVSSARFLYRKIYCLSFPLFLLLALISNEIVTIVLGNSWIGASFYLTILFYSCIGDLVAAMLRNFLKSEGRTKQITTLEIIKSSIKLLFIAISIPLGIKVLIYSILVSSIINAIIAMWFTHNCTSYSFKKQLIDVIEPLAISLIVYLLFAFIVSMVGHSLWNIVLFFAGFLVYFVLAFTVRNSDAIFLLKYAKKIIIRK